MNELEQFKCSFCGDLADHAAFAVDDTQFSAKRKVRLIQGDRTRTGQRGEIVSGKSPTHNPGIYEVRLEDGHIVLVRWDHMMFEDMIERDQHYRELYEHRVKCCAYEYKETKF